MVKYLAILMTTTAAFMAAVAAWHRGGNPVEQMLLVTMSVTMVVAVHLIPAISKKPYAWLIWLGCLLGAIYGHLTFLTHASVEAAQVRSQQSAAVVSLHKQIDMTQAALGSITARPIAIVAAELAHEDDKRVRAALREEISEGRRAEQLRSDLLQLQSKAATAEIENTTDPVTSRLALLLNVPEPVIVIVIGMIFSIVLELAGAFLWAEVGRKEKKQPVTPVTTPITELRDAIRNGKCKPTVAGIRAYLKCSQEKAMMLRRELTV